MLVLLLRCEFWHQWLTRQPLRRNNVFLIIIAPLYHIFMHDFEALGWALTIYFYHLPVSTAVSSAWNRRQLENLILRIDAGALVLQVKAFVYLLVFFFDVVYVFLHDLRLYIINLIFGKANRGVCGVLMWTLIILNTGLKLLWRWWGYLFGLTPLCKLRTLLTKNHMVNQIDGVFDHSVSVSRATLLGRKNFVKRSGFGQRWRRSWQLLNGLYLYLELGLLNFGYT